VEEMTMFSMDLQAKIRSATATRKTSTEGDVSDSTSVALAMEFTEAVAGAMGERGLTFYRALADGGLKTATLDLKSVAVVLNVGKGGNADDMLKLNKETRAVSLKLSPPAKDGAVPVGVLTIITPTEYDHLLWFVERLEEVHPLRVDLQQTELAV
jgi:hypothetical protein